MLFLRQLWKECSSYILSTERDDVERGPLAHGANHGDCSAVSSHHPRIRMVSLKYEEESVASDWCPTRNSHTALSKLRRHLEYSFGLSDERLTGVHAPNRFHLPMRV